MWMLVSLVVSLFLAGPSAPVDSLGIPGAVAAVAAVAPGAEPVAPAAQWRTVSTSEVMGLTEPTPGNACTVATVARASSIAAQVGILTIVISLAVALLIKLTAWLLRFTRTPA
jgi:hypothetical protein